MIHFDQESRRALSARVGWNVKRVLLAIMFASVFIGVGLHSGDGHVAGTPGETAQARVSDHLTAVEVLWGENLADAAGTSGLLHEAPIHPRSFIVADPRMGPSGLGHLVVPVLAVIAVFLGTVRAVSLEMPVLPVRRWKGRARGVPLHRGPPVPA
ncbi:hypothetical protein [Stackebrandtia soli]|uniref:hypothetical protein n=1 Tax=Stackebrandtia soli TaxID=1892856 RepID=UPI0039E972E8